MDKTPKGEGAEPEDREKRVLLPHLQIRCPNCGASDVVSGVNAGGGYYSVRVFCRSCRAKFKASLPFVPDALRSPSPGGD